MRWLKLAALIAGGATLVACAATAPDRGQDEPVNPTDTDTGELDTNTDCIELELTVNGTASATATAGSHVQFRARAINRSAGPVTIETIDRCPNGQAAFAGLPNAFDYYDTCADGICETTGDPIDRIVESGETWVIADVAIDTSGGTCSTAVPAGDYLLSFEIQQRGTEQPNYCGVPQANLTLE